MICALDACVLLDVFIEDPEWTRPSRTLLESLAGISDFVICPEVYAEVLPHAPSSAFLDAVLSDFGLLVVATDVAVARVAGEMWAQYRRAGGPRLRILTDSVVAAHALVHADAFVTRDDGFFRSYFSDLTVITPQPADG
ncbi:MAG: type II toxin-antitoxin system VapC family toxin [Armatimonadetes bacterium]|nr:type II toxin-antitoxin system VapC family toxin [Armatimonadota bacterium]